MRTDVQTLTSGLLALCLISPLAGGVKPASGVSEKALRLHRESIVIDAYSATQFYYRPDFGTGTPGGKYDLPKALRGGVTGANFGVGAEELFVGDPRLGVLDPPPPGVNVIDAFFKGPNIVKRILWELDALYETVRQHSSQMLAARNAADIRRAKAEGEFAVIIGTNHGWFDSDLAVLRSYHRMGLRVLALTHGDWLGWASSDREQPGVAGLTDFGRAVVEECNRLGVVVDLSHASRETFRDTLSVTRDPVLATHNGCYALGPIQRNLTDDQLRSLARNGGVVGIIAVGDFLEVERLKARIEGDSFDQMLQSHLSRAAAYQDRPFDWVRKARETALERSRAKRRNPLDRYGDVMAAPAPPVSLERMLDHLDHAVRVAGIDHVAIGTDFDGGGALKSFEDASKFPQVTEALLRRGYGEEEIRKLLGENFLRVFRQVTE